MCTSRKPHRTSSPPHSQPLHVLVAGRCSFFVRSCKQTTIFGRRPQGWQRRLKSAADKRAPLFCYLSSFPSLEHQSLSGVSDKTNIAQIILGAFCYRTEARKLRSSYLSVVTTHAKACSCSSQGAVAHGIESIDLISVRSH